MKQSLYTLFLSVLLFSCTREQNSFTSSVTHHFSINAVMNELEEEQFTKATGISIIKLKWTAGDKVSVVNITTGKALGGDLTASTTGTYSTFSGDLTGTISNGDKLAFIYPSQNYTSEVDFTPVEIDYSVQSSSSPSLVMIAHHTVDSGTDFQTGIYVEFNFQMSFMRLNLSQLPVSTTIKSVQINGVNDRIRLSISDGNMISGTDSVNRYIRYTKEFTTDVRGCQSISVGILRTSPTTGRTVTVTTATNAYSAYFGNGTLKVNSSYYTVLNGFDKISFADSKVEQYCLANFDYDHDNKISFAEAASVQSFPSSTSSPVATKAASGPIPTDITSFTELEYFTGLTSYPCFQGYTSLQSVSVPEQITLIPNNCFNGCTALTKIIMYPTTPPTLGTNVFASTNATVYVPESSVDAYKAKEGYSDDKIKDHSYIDIVSIPDANFKAYLVSNFDTDNDGEISAGEASIPTSMTFCTDNIATIEGIKSFVNLKYLSANGTYDTKSNGKLQIVDVSGMENLTTLNLRDNQLNSLNTDGCGAVTYVDVYRNNLSSVNFSSNTCLDVLTVAMNKLTVLDVSNNTALTDLNCCYNVLTGLDLSSNTALTNLTCHENQLADLDLSQNTALTYISCGYNIFTDLNLNNNTALTNLSCQSTQLTTLGLSKNKALTYISCQGNQLTALDVSENTALTYFDCSYNSITALDVTKNTSLTNIRCGFNKLSTLDVSKNTSLTSLVCSSNNLSTLDVSRNTSLDYLYCDGNSSMTELWLKTGQTIEHLTKDSQTEIKYKSYIDIPDANFKAYLVSNFDIDNDGEISTGEASIPTQMNFCTDDIASIEGIKSFVNLEYLYAVGTYGYDGNYYPNGILQNADVSGMQHLKQIHMNYNQLNSLNVDECGSLIVIEVQYNHLSYMDISSNTGLKEVSVYANCLTELDISKSTALTYLDCGRNQLEALDVSKNTALTNLSCNENQLESLDVSTNTALTYLCCTSNNLTALDVTKNITLTKLQCNYNSISTLDVSKNTALTELLCNNNNLAILDVSNNTAVTYLQCFSNQLTELDLGENAVLTQLLCYSNQLAELDLRKNTALTYVCCSHNNLTTLDVSMNASLSYLYCDGNSSLTELWLKTGQTIANLKKDDQTIIKYKNNTPGAGENEGVDYEKDTHYNHTYGRHHGVGLLQVR